MSVASRIVQFTKELAASTPPPNSGLDWVEHLAECDEPNLTSFPANITTVEKKVLRTLAATYPRTYDAASLIHIVGETSDRIRHAFATLHKEGFLDSRPIPRALRDDGEAETHFYVFREKEFDRATEYLWASDQAASSLKL